MIVNVGEAPLSYCCIEIEAANLINLLKPNFCSLVLQDYFGKPKIDKEIKHIYLYIYILITAKHPKHEHFSHNWVLCLQITSILGSNCLTSYILVGLSTTTT